MQLGRRRRRGYRQQKGERGWWERRGKRKRFHNCLFWNKSFYLLFQPQIVIYLKLTVKTWVELRVTTWLAWTGYFEGLFIEFCKIEGLNWVKFIFWEIKLKFILINYTNFLKIWSQCNLLLYVSSREIPYNCPVLILPISFVVFLLEKVVSSSLIDNCSFMYVYIVEMFY